MGKHVSADETLEIEYFSFSFSSHIAVFSVVQSKYQFHTT